MIEQYSDAWFKARCGRATASRMADLTARTKSGWGASRANYAAQLIAERLTGVPAESYSNAAMQWGIATEPDARMAYEFRTDAEVEPCGFILHAEIEMAGATPDGFVGDRGLLEIKCPNTSTHIDTLLSGTVPDKYVKQMQWQMACTDRQWCDFVSFDPRMPEPMRLFIKRTPRAGNDIRSLEGSVKDFLLEIDNKLDALRSRYLGAPSALKADLQASVEAAQQMLDRPKPYPMKPDVENLIVRAAKQHAEHVIRQRLDDIASVQNPPEHAFLGAIYILKETPYRLHAKLEIHESSNLYLAIDTVRRFRRSNGVVHVFKQVPISARGDNYILDFLLGAKRERRVELLAVECDGWGAHGGGAFGKNPKDQIEYDKERDNAIWETWGIPTQRFSAAKITRNLLLCAEQAVGRLGYDFQELLAKGRRNELAKARRQRKKLSKKIAAEILRGKSLAEQAAIVATLHLHMNGAVKP